MEITANKRYYDYPSTKFNFELYAGQDIRGIMSSYQFTEYGLQVLNTWLESCGTEEITENRRLILENQFKSNLASLINSGDAIKHPSGEFVQTVKWYETVSGV